MNKYLFTFICSFLFCLNLQAQYYPKNYFIAPMDTPLQLSAPFGSLRENHFHSGMDIRTNEQEGLPVYAIADGYVSRIKIQSIGYGNALYIAHKNGYTSVYGHLKEYEKSIAIYVHQIQYKNEQFDMDHFPKKDVLKIVKGQLIGYSGNSGTSTGPHLHFEIRDNRTEEIINPLFFGIHVLDTLPPIIQKIRTYALNEQHPKFSNSYDLNLENCILTDSGYLFRDTLFTADGVSGLGILTSDKLTDLNKLYSIYGIDLFVDQQKYFSFRLNRFAFDQTRCVNVHIDYANFRKSGERIQKLFVDNGNDISLYPYLRNHGKLHLAPESIHAVAINVLDFNGHIAVYHFMLKAHKEFNTTITSDTGTLVLPNRLTQLFCFNNSVTIPINALYDTSAIAIYLVKENNHIFNVGNANIPLRKNISISLEIPNHISSNTYSKLCMAWQPDAGSNWRYCNAEIQDRMMVGKNLQFGRYSLMIDSIPPSVKLLPFSELDSGNLYVSITDEFSGIGQYKAYINDRWVLMAYDAKNNLLTYKPDEIIESEKSKSTLIFTLEVTDRRNNRTSKTWNIKSRYEISIH